MAVTAGCCYKSSSWVTTWVIEADWRASHRLKMYCESKPSREKKTWTQYGMFISSGFSSHIQIYKPEITLHNSKTVAELHHVHFELLFHPMIYVSRLSVHITPASCFQCAEQLSKSKEVVTVFCIWWHFCTQFLDHSCKRKKIHVQFTEITQEKQQLNLQITLLEEPSSRHTLSQ